MGLLGGLIPLSAPLLLQEEVSLAVGLALVGILFLAPAASLVIVLSVERYPLGSPVLLRAPAIRGGITDVLNRVVQLAILVALCSSSSGEIGRAHV